MNRDIFLRTKIKDLLDIPKLKAIEILSPYECNSFVNLLKKDLEEMHIMVYITYTNGPIEEEINQGFREFLDKKIEKYKKLISMEFGRITIESPFPMPISLTKQVSLYQKHIQELSFVNEYLIHAQRVKIVKPNSLWAKKIGVSLEELENKIYELERKTPELSLHLDYINGLHLEELHFVSKNGTDLTCKLPKDAIFVGNRLTINGTSFCPNFPSQEIFTTPLKDGVNGKIVITKPIFYKNRVFKDCEILFSNGKIIESKNMDFILSLDESLSYAGEIALAPYDPFLFLNTLLDENTGIHIALGNSYPYTTKDTNINHSLYHIDMVFASADMNVYGKNKDMEYILFQDGRLVI